MVFPGYNSFEIVPILDSQHAVRLTVSNSPLNLLNGAFLTEFHDYLTSLEKSPGNGPKVVVIASADKDVWLHHLDLHIISARYPLQNAEDDAGHLLHLLGDILKLLKTLPTVFIAEINGSAVGGGNEFAVNMDMRFAGPSARFGVPEVAGGVVHGGGLQQLTKLLGPGQAMEFMLSARAIDGRQAERIGLVNRYTEDEAHLRDFVDRLAARIAMWSRGAIDGTKVGVRECLDGTGSMGRDLHRLGELAHTADAQKAISDFIERGQDQSRSKWELALPDSCENIWRH